MPRSAACWPSAGASSLARQVDGVPGLLDVLIEHATQADVGKRTEDVATFLEELDIVREEIVESEAEGVASTDPLEAGKGDELEGGFRVLQRLGRGSTALALRVESGGVEGVLKVSLDPDKDERLHKEAAVLATVPAQQRHEGIVELLDGPMTVGGRLALLLTSAGERTLAQALRERGRLQPEWFDCRPH